MSGDRSGSEPGNRESEPGEWPIRRAAESDYEAVRSFTENTWPDHGGDYLPDIYHEWIAGDGTDQRTFVAERNGRAVGICQGVLLTDGEGWAQGLRVDPAVRGQGVSAALCGAVLDWTATQGAAVCRSMVFSWNEAGMGTARATGFDPHTEFRWAHPEPDRSATPELSVHGNPTLAWQYWRRSEACDRLRGLALDPTESWAVSLLTGATLQWAAEETRLIVVLDETGVVGVTHRVRDYERPADGEGDDIERWAEYGVGAWTDAEGARSLLAAIAKDAASIGADRTRVLIPETPRHVSDVALARTATSSEPDFVFEADLSGR